MHQPVIATQVIVGFHSPAMLDPDFACMEIINDALVGGDSSRLEERLVIQEELASDIEGYVTPFSEPGLYIFSMTLRAGVDPQHALAVLQEELDRVALGLEDWEIDKAKNGLELGLIDGFRDVDGCAEAIGHYEVCYGDFSLAFKVLNRFSELESNDIAQAARRVFSPSRRNTVIALADGSI
ncbi:MAG: insulinase family protein [Myxococcota bacterium]